MQSKILELLRSVGDGFISGEDIAGKLGVSRTAVWKHINELKGAGYDIVSQPHKGYALREAPDILLPNELRPLLNTVTIGREIIHYDSVSSSNNEAKRLALAGAKDGTVVVAEEQGAGKGRLSRGWFSPPGKGIWFSVIIRPPFLPQDAPKCTLMAAVAIVRAARKYGLDLGIKWPNDVIYEGKKLVGILTEMNAEMERINYIVIGTGINVNLWPEDFPEEVRDVATSLAMARGEELPRKELFARILNSFDDLYQSVLKEGFAAVLDEWRRYTITLGRVVNVIGVKETFYGSAVDIDEDGALLIETSEGIRKVLAGDVSIRPRNDDGSSAKY